MTAEPTSMTFGMLIDLFGLLVLSAFVSFVVVGLAMMTIAWVREKLESYIGYRFNFEFTWHEMESDIQNESEQGGEK